MKRVQNYESLPHHARYIGSTNGDGSMYESLANALDLAVEPVYFDDETGRHYFELAKERA